MLAFNLSMKLRMSFSKKKKSVKKKNTKKKQSIKFSNSFSTERREERLRKSLSICVQSFSVKGLMF